MTENRTDLLGALRAGWWIVPVILAASLGSVAYLTADEAPPVYEAAATLAVTPDSSIQNEPQVLRSLELLERRTMVSTLSRIPTSGFMRARAADALNTTPEQLASYRVETNILPSTHLIRVSVRGPEPDVAERYANALAMGAQATGDRYYRVYALRIVDRAETPVSPVEGSERRTYAVAGILGLVLGVGGAWGVGTLRTAGA